ncbi:hypothetical protein PF005_g3120 [Phytophthora fragariae]|uniref:Uncharacterized protein n=1 Tax=Phytophthora fragariae TaxID=53985 RepID=A0A6A3Z712_9STRA|nr:hypothetical protein PF005_g3120 [Phytophthora fragariae]
MELIEAHQHQNKERRRKGRECQPTTAVRCSSAATAQTPPPPDSAGTCGGADFEQLGCGTPTTQRARAIGHVRWCGL